ncbi:MAG: hypothetical protein AAGB14_15145, partial [Verrucomicrobiota bacterium]
MGRPVDALLDYLRVEEARGTESVYLDDEAKELLREFHRRSREGKKAATAAPRPNRQSTPATALKEDPAPVKTVAKIEVTGSTAVERIDSLRGQAASWGPAKALGSLRETMVFSTGNPEAELMLVGEAPGYQEERQ